MTEPTLDQLVSTYLEKQSELESLTTEVSDLKSKILSLIEDGSTVETDNYTITKKIQNPRFSGFANEDSIYEALLSLEDPSILRPLLSFSKSKIQKIFTDHNLNTAILDELTTPTQPKLIIESAGGWS